MPERLSEDEARTRIAGLAGWQVDDDTLRVRYDAPDVPTMVEIVARMFAAAEEANHHPDVDLRWKRLTVRLTTHDVGGLTDADVEMAERIAGIAREHDATPMPDD